MLTLQERAHGLLVKARLDIQDEYDAGSYRHCVAGTVGRHAGILCGAALFTPDPPPAYTVAMVALWDTRPCDPRIYRTVIGRSTTVARRVEYVARQLQSALPAGKDRRVVEAWLARAAGLLAPEPDWPKPDLETRKAVLV